MFHKLTPRTPGVGHIYRSAFGTASFGPPTYQRGGLAGIQDNGSVLDLISNPGLPIPTLGNNFAFRAFGSPGSWTGLIQGALISGDSFGLWMRAGYVASDECVLFQNALGTNNYQVIWGDGTGQLGYMGAGLGNSALSWNGAAAVGVNINKSALPAQGAAYPSLFFGGYSGGSPVVSGCIMSDQLGGIYTVGNLYYDGTNYRYLNAGGGSLLVTAGSSMQFFSAPSGSAGAVATITMNFQMTGLLTAPTIQAYGPTAAGMVDMTPDQGTFTGTWTGFSTTVTNTCVWSKNGNQIDLLLPPANGTSNATTMTMTGLPTILETARVTENMMTLENSGTSAVGMIKFAASSTTITFASSVANAAWTASGTKGNIWDQVIPYIRN